MYLLHHILGAAAFAGLGVMVLSIPIECGVAVWTKRFQVTRVDENGGLGADRFISTVGFIASPTGDHFQCLLNSEHYPYDDRIP